MTERKVRYGNETEEEAEERERRTKWVTIGFVIAAIAIVGSLIAAAFGHPLV